MTTPTLLRPFLFIIGYLVIGMVIVISLEQLRLENRMISSLTILLAFLVFNLILNHFLDLKNELRNFWSLKKIWLLPVGLTGGLLIAVFPLLLSLLVSGTHFSDITLAQEVSVSGIVTTLFIVSWEELWFRGLIVNYCRRYLSATWLSLLMGLLFVLLHFLNPKIDLIQAGPALFFAGALLTLLYLSFQSIWLPIGLHFGNNYANGLFSYASEQDPWFGKDGYVSALLLATLFFLFVKKRRQDLAKEINNTTY